MSDPDAPGHTTLGIPGDEAAGTRIGPFRILRLLGEGGFGAVYEAEQEQPVRRRVALKVIKLGMDTREVIARFEAERQALALMDHPHIARVFDAGATETGRPYFVMELVKGEPISNYCIHRGLSIEQRLELFEQVCAAVQHAHAKGIIHRDLKPNNVLVSEHDGQPFAQVIDFGIAKATSGRLTDKTLQTEQFLMMGTPLYMSPEQAAGTDIDARTDIYALGAILYELLTDSTPIASDSLNSAAYGEVQRIIRDVDPPIPSARLLQSARITLGDGGRRSMDPRKLAAIVRGDLDWIVMKAIDKDRGRRYATANDLGMDLRRHREGQPVVAAPPGIGYRLGKSVRRHRHELMVGVLLIAVVLATIAGVDRWSAMHAGSTLAINVAPAASGKSIAVLPFENLSSDKDNAYFAEGMQDMILTRLAGIRELKVISRTSTAQYASRPDNLKTIAQQLGVTTILEGSVQKSGNQVLINLQLIDAVNDRHLWANSYRRTLDNVFDVEGEVAQAVANELDAKLTAAERQAVRTRSTSIPAAYDAYLRGLAFTPKAENGAREAVSAFAEAVRQDPGFALAWSWLSREHAWMYFSGEDHSEDRRRQAREAMDTVERLAPGSAESLLAHGYYAYRVDRDFEGARQFFERARVASPNDVESLWPLAMIARRQGRWQQSIDLLEQAMSVDPRNLLTIEGAITTYSSMRDDRNALRIVERGLAFAPDSQGMLGNQAGIFLEAGDLASLRKQLERWHAKRAKGEYWFPEEYFIYARDYAAGIAFLKDELADVDDAVGRAPGQWLLGDMYRLSGDAASAKSNYQQARAALEASLKSGSDNALGMRTLAMVDVGLGDKDSAIATARRAIAIDTRFGDRYQTPKDEETLARVQARFGDKDAAIAALRRLLAIPYEDPVTVATLRLDPDFDNLRSDPEFQKLLDHAVEKIGP